MLSLLIIICVFVSVLLVVQLSILISVFKNRKRTGIYGTNFNNHSVIIGWNESSNYVADQLIGVGKKIAIVTDEKMNISLIYDRFKSKDVFVLHNDYDNINLLKKVNIEKANSVFINMEGDARKLVYAKQLKEVFSIFNLITTLENGELKKAFSSAGINNTISTNEIASKLLSSYMFEPDVASFSETLLSYANSEDDYDMKQLLVTSVNPYNGRKYLEAFLDLKMNYNCILIGITKHDKYGQKKLIKNPYGDMKIDTGNYLLVILNGQAFNILKHIFKVHEGVDMNIIKAK